MPFFEASSLVSGLDEACFVADFCLACHDFSGRLLGGNARISVKHMCNFHFGGCALSSPMFLAELASLIILGIRVVLDAPGLMGCPHGVHAGISRTVVGARGGELSGS
jgi:hypothetical protein